MEDLLYIAVAAVFFGLTFLLVRLCETLSGPDERGR